MPSLEDLTVPELLAHAKSQEKSAALLNTLLNGGDAEIREKTLRLIKQKNPGMNIPEIDARAAVEKGLDEERSARQALEARILERDANDRIEKARASIKSEFDLSDDDVAKVEKLMVEDQIGTHRGAAKVFKASQKPAEPTPAALATPTYSMPDKDVWGKTIGNRALLNKTAMEVAYAASAEFRGGKAA